MGRDRALKDDDERAVVIRTHSGRRAVHPTELRERYFRAQGNRYAFRTDLRRNLIFGRHDLARDAPISRVMLVTCRNTLMYYNAEAQDQVIQRLHFALGNRGLLVLGKAETLLTQSRLFAQVDIGRRMFRKMPGSRLRNQLLALPHARHSPESHPDGRADAVQPACPDTVSGLPRARRASRSRTSKCPTARWSCGPQSTAPPPNAVRCACLTWPGTGTTAPAGSR